MIGEAGARRHHNGVDDPGQLHDDVAHICAWAVLSLALVAARVLAKTAAPKPSGAIIVDETDVGLLFGG